MLDKVLKAWECCGSFNKRCAECPYENDCFHDSFDRVAIADMVKLLKDQQAEIDHMKAEKRKEEIKVGDEVASVNPATGELNLWNTFIVTEIGEDFIGGINSKGETHYHDEPGIFNIWVKTGKHIDILRAFEPVETASAKEGEQE